MTDHCAKHGGILDCISVVHGSLPFPAPSNLRSAYNFAYRGQHAALGSLWWEGSCSVDLSQMSGFLLSTSALIRDVNTILHVSVPVFHSPAFSSCPHTVLLLVASSGNCQGTSRTGEKTEERVDISDCSHERQC